MSGCFDSSANECTCVAVRWFRGLVVVLRGSDGEPAGPHSRISISGGLPTIVPPHGVSSRPPVRVRDGCGGSCGTCRLASRRSSRRHPQLQRALPEPMSVATVGSLPIRTHAAPTITTAGTIALSGRPMLAENFPRPRRSARR